MMSFDTERLVARRRYLHSIPELMFEEKLTQAFVLEELSKMGVSAKPIAKTGVICRFGPDGADGAFALRADLDGLPMQELADVPYKSKHANVMHACGHDGHTAALLTVAEVIKDWNLKRPVVLLFQVHAVSIVLSTVH